MGRMPYTPASPSAGAQRVPVRKSTALYFPKNGRPFQNRNTQISATAATQHSAASANTPRISFSFSCMNFFPFISFVTRSAYKRYVKCRGAGM